MNNTSLQGFIPVLGVNYKTNEWSFAEQLLNSKDLGWDCPHSSFRDFLLERAFDEDLSQKKLVVTESILLDDGCRLSFGSDGDKNIVTSQGIYFVFRHFGFEDIDGDHAFECVYIGKTNNLLNRFSQHHKKAAFIKLRCSICYFVQYSPDFYTEFDLLWAERQYINLLKPILNDCSASYLSNGNSEDAKNKIADDYRLVYEQGYKQGVKDGFASAKNQVIDWFDSNLKAPV